MPSPLAAPTPSLPPVSSTSASTPSCDFAHVDFWLFPVPLELTKDWDDREQLIDLVDSIPIHKRLTTVKIERDESIIDRIKDKIPHCQNYYEKLIGEIK